MALALVACTAVHENKASVSKPPSPKARARSLPIAAKIGLQLKDFPKGWSEHETSGKASFADIGRLSSCLGVAKPSHEPVVSPRFIHKVAPKPTNSGIKGVSYLRLAESLTWLRRSSKVADTFVKSLATSRGIDCILTASGASSSFASHLTKLDLPIVGQAVAGFSFALIPPAGTNSSKSLSPGAMGSSSVGLPLPPTYTDISFVASGRAMVAVVVSSIGAPVPIGLVPHLLKEVATRAGAISQARRPL
jgi:hypothetical protein